MKWLSLFIYFFVSFAGQVDVNTPDSENVYVLHWAAINNRLDIVK